MTPVPLHAGRRRPARSPPNPRPRHPRSLRPGAPFVLGRLGGVLGLRGGTGVTTPHGDGGARAGRGHRHADTEQQAPVQQPPDTGPLRSDRPDLAQRLTAGPMTPSGRRWCRRPPRRPPDAAQPTPVRPERRPPDVAWPTPCARRRPRRVRHSCPERPGGLPGPLSFPRAFPPGWPARRRPCACADPPPHCVRLVPIAAAPLVVRLVLIRDTVNLPSVIPLSQASRLCWVQSSRATGTVMTGGNLQRRNVRPFSWPDEESIA